MIEYATEEAETIRTFLESHDSFWYWDNHAHVAQLTSGKLSDFFANCSPIFTDPGFQERVGKMLATLLNLSSFANEPNLWVVGSAMGAIGLAQSLAQVIHAKCAFTEPEDGGMSLKRFHLGISPAVVICEDVMTTGGTTIKTIEGILAKHPGAKIHDRIPVVVDRRVDRVNNLFVARHSASAECTVRGLLQVTPRVWDDESGLPEEMKGCVPLRPKGNWAKLKEKRDG